MLPQNIKTLIEEFNRLPGVGPKTAERLAFHVLKQNNTKITSLGEAILNIQNNLGFCSLCYSIMSQDHTDLCKVCDNPNRDKGIICVVQEVMDAVAIEKSGIYTGVYHILHGALSPIDGIGPANIKIMELINRVKDNQFNISELILATNPNMSGEATNMFIMNELRGLEIKTTTIARGIPMGGELEYADQITLKRAFQGRINA